MPKGRVVIGCVVALLLSFSFAIGQDKNDDKQKEEEAKEKIAEFRKVLKGAKTDMEVSAAISALGEVKHSKILKELIKYVTSNNATVRKIAIDCVGEYKNDKTAAGTLLDLISLYKKEKDVIVAVLDALGKVAYEPSAAAINRLIADKDTDAAVAAVGALGNIRSRSSIEPLVSLLKEVDLAIIDADPNNPKRDLALEEVNRQRQERKSRLAGPIKSTLQSITKQSFDKAKDWEDWWRKNSSTFKVENK